MKYFQTEGVQFDPVEDVTVDMFADAWPRISDLTGAAPMGRSRGRLEARLRAMGRIK